jgi:hypothetical protein
MFNYNVEYSSINGNWYKSFFVVTFNLWKFTQIYNFHFFLAPLQLEKAMLRLLLAI